jgi:hypothetical protein
MANYSASFPGAIKGLSIADLEREVSRAQTRTKNKKLVNAEKERLLFKRLYNTIETPVYNTLGSAAPYNPGGLQIETVYEKQKELYNAYPGCAKKFWEANEMQYVGMLGSHATPQSRIGNFIQLFLDTEKHCSYMKNRNAFKNQAEKEAQNKERYSRVKTGNLLGLNAPAAPSGKNGNLLRNLFSINFSPPKDQFEGLGGKRKTRRRKQSKKTRKAKRT